MGADLDLALDQWELRDRSRDAALEAGSVVLWEASMLHALHLPKNVLADHHQKEEKKNHQNEHKISKTSLALCDQTTVNH